MASSSGLLCLKWNNHTSAFDKLLNNLHLRDVYSDGTIVCHGKFYPVHRFVLSTCSEYFEEIFRQSINLKSKHPFIIVKDIHPPQMEALLNYMYRGEVNVPQEMLPDLIKAAEAFKIKGLAVPDDEPPPIKSSSSRDRKRTSANLTSPSSQVKKSRKLDDSAKNTKVNLRTETDKHNDDLRTECNSSNSSKNFPSNSDVKETEELYITDIPPSEVKSEPADIPEYNDNEVPDHNPPLEDFMLPKEHTVKDEKSFESYVSSEPFPPYEDDENPPSDDQFDMGQSSSWDNSQAFEGDGNMEDTESAQGVRMDTPFSTFQKRVVNEETVAIMSSQQSIHQCSQCTYQTNNLSHMNRHFRIHTGEKPYQCSVCSYRSSQKVNLMTHMLVHTGEKRFECSICSYKSSLKGNLKKHMSVHTGENSFRCSECSYKSSLREKLATHMLIHTREKSFNCSPVLKHDNPEASSEKSFD